jgi:CspA family cold shock protein
MSATNNTETTVRGTETFSSTERLVGCVKWFNNKAGYGFITVSEGERSGTDVFIHHSSINVKNQQYKYLVQGEYVEFSVISTSGGSHEFQAADVSGIKNGKLMCETRFEMKLERNHNHVQEETTGTNDRNDTNDTNDVRLPRTKRPPPTQGQNYTEAPKARGEGPRNGNEWTQVRRTTETRPRQETRQAKKHV